MQEIHLDNLNSEEFPNGSILTLGNFDGIHLGHITLLEQLKIAKRKLNLPSILVTYYPNPSIVLGKNKNLKAIFSEKSKKRILSKFDVDYLLVIPFTEEFSKITAGEFTELILKKKLNAKHIIIGFNHFFGKGREGNFDFLKNLSTKFDFTVEKIESVIFQNEQVSSSLIRNLIQNGEMKKTSMMLTRNFLLEGKIVKGFQRGRTIGFPTANIELEEDIILPKFGVYIAKVILSNETFFGMMNIGKNPSFEDFKLHIEVNIFDFEKDIYGENIIVELIQYIREEKKFNSIDELKIQIQKDKFFSLNFIKENNYI